MLDEFVYKPPSEYSQRVRAAVVRPLKTSDGSSYGCGGKGEKVVKLVSLTQSRMLEDCVLEHLLEGLPVRSAAVPISTFPISAVSVWRSR